MTDFMTNVVHPSFSNLLIETYYDKEWYEIYKLPIIKKELAHYLTEAHDVMSGRDILWKEKKKRDLVLIYRK